MGTIIPFLRDDLRDSVFEPHDIKAMSLALDDVSAVLKLQDIDGTFRMLALIYVFTIWCVAAILYVTVNEFEPNRRLAFVLKFLILAVGAAAIARRLLH
jgi:hypothetical protein